MVLEKLGNMLIETIDKIKRAMIVDKKTVELIVHDLQRALLLADVDVSLVMKISEAVKKKALEEELPSGVSRRQHLIKVIFDELINLLGGKATYSIVYKDKPHIIMLVGIQGSGKTTTAAKLAHFFKKRGLKVGLISTDTYRPGAFEQLKQLADKINVSMYYPSKRKNAIKLAKDGINYFKKEAFDVIIVDTAGRHKDEKSLMNEMKQISKAIKPSEIMLVIDGTIGQQAYSQAQAFQENTTIGTIFVTKLDGSARGGGALSAVVATGAKIAFIGTGEHIDDIELFDATKFIERLLGIPNIEDLVKKVKEAQLAPSKEKTLKILKGRFTLLDFYEQLSSLPKLGSIDKILQYMGVGAKVPPGYEDIAKEKLGRWKVILQSMTAEELRDPKIINSSRINRIARGSGTSGKDVKELLKQYRAMKNLMKKMGKKGLRKYQDLSKLGMLK